MDSGLVLIVIADQASIAAGGTETILSGDVVYLQTGQIS